MIMVISAGGHAISAIDQQAVCSLVTPAALLPGMTSDADVDYHGVDLGRCM